MPSIQPPGLRQDPKCILKQSMLIPPLNIRSPSKVDRCSTQRTRVVVAGLEPLIQTKAMEEVLACGARLLGNALVRGDDAVANGTFAVAPDGSREIASEGLHTINDIAVRKSDDALCSHDPTLPLPLVDGDAADASGSDTFNGEVVWKLDGHGALRLVDLVCDCDLFATLRDFDADICLVG